MSSFKDFLHPIWRKSLDQLKMTDSIELNNTILDTIDAVLHKVEDETIASKSELFIKTAANEWLDYWGSWFGLKRKKGQSDDDYRAALIMHVRHPRTAKPALREAIAHFLESSIGNVHVYEPWMDIFILDQSKLDSQAAFQSSYYHYGIIDISISVPFPPEVIDIINWFRPVGVLWVLTYAPGGSANAPIWDMSPADAQIQQELLTITMISGLEQRLNQVLSPASQDGGKGFSPFYTDDSDLTGTDRLNGGNLSSNGTYNFVGYLHGQIMPTQADSPYSIAQQIDTVDHHEYPKLATTDNDSVPFEISNQIKLYNLLFGTHNLNAWQQGYSDQTYNDTYHGNTVKILPVDGASIATSQKPKLINGRQYIFSVVAKADNNARVKLEFTTDEAHQDIVLTNNLTEDYTRYFIQFTYTGTDTLPAEVKIDGDISQSGNVYVTSPMLRALNPVVSGWDTDIPDWTDAPQDYSTQLTPADEYIYGAFNVREFFYNQVQDETTVKHETGYYATGDQLNAYMDNYLSLKTLAINYKASGLLGDTSKVNLMIYNFKLLTWVNLETLNLTEDTVDQSQRLYSLLPYLNDNGLLLVALQVETVSHDFKLNLNSIRLVVDKTLSNKTSINIFDQDGQSSTGTEVSEKWFYDNTNDTRELVDRFQQYYPIRYIRNTIRDVHFYDPDDANGFQEFSLNLSNMNSESYLADKEAEWQRALESQSYVPCVVNAKYDTHQEGNYPVTSISILGASVNDMEHKNVLGNLLPGGIFTSSFTNEWQALGPNTQLTSYKKDNSDKLTGLRVKVSPMDQLQGIKITCEDTFSEENYRFDFDSASLDNTVKDCVVKVYFNTNGYHYLAKQAVVTINPQTNHYTVKFDTTQVFPDSIDIEILAPTNASADIYFNNLQLRLDVSVMVDNAYVDRLAPGMVPQLSPKLDPTSNTANYSDLVGQLTYDDIEFDPNYKMKFDDGLSFDNLKYGDMLTDEGLAKYSKLDPPKVKGALNYLKTVNYYLHKTNNKNAYTFQQLLDQRINYFNSLGYGRFQNEHTVTIDLRKVHKDIAELLVQHGSDSNSEVKYDSCLQTSVDGIHWHTWYDNYKGLRNDLYYQEPLSSPKHFELTPYNALAYREDFGITYDSLGDDDYTLSTIGADMSAVADRYPSYGLSNLVFNDLGYQILSSNNLTHDDSGGNSYTFDTPLHKDGPLIVPDDKGKLVPDVPGITTTTTQRRKDGTPGKTFFDWRHNRYTFGDFNKSKMDFGELWESSVTATTSTTTDRETTTTTTQKPMPEDWYFILDDLQSVLNGTQRLLPDSRYIPDVDPDNPHNGGVLVDSDMLISQKLLSFDIVKIVTNKYPALWETLNITSRQEKAHFISQYLIGAKKPPVMWLDVDALTTGDILSLSLWHTDDNGSWQQFQEARSNSEQSLEITSNDLTNVMNSQGYIYGLVMSQAYNGHVNDIDLIKAELKFSINPKGINNYGGGMYPHLNYVMDNHVIRALGKRDITLVNSYLLDRKVLGHKVTVSFNVNNDGTTGDLYLVGNGIRLPDTRHFMLENDHQHFSMTLMLPDETSSNDPPKIDLYFENSMATITVTAFKVEIGENESPYVTYENASV